MTTTQDDQSRFERLPNELHAFIAEHSSPQAISRVCRTNRRLNGRYLDLLYRQDIKEQDSRSMFDIARTGMVGCFEDLVRITKEISQGQEPDFNRYEVVLNKELRITPFFPGLQFPIPASNFRLTERCCTPLHLAVSHGCHEAASYLIGRQVDVNALGFLCDPTLRPGFGATQPMVNMLGLGEFHTALHMAVCRNNLAMCQLLAGNGASMFSDPRKGSGRTMLHVAALCGHEAIVRWLVEGGHVAIGALDQSQPPLSALQYATVTEKGARILGLLQDLGADITPALDIMLDNHEWHTALRVVRDQGLRLRSNGGGVSWQTRSLVKCLSLRTMPTFRSGDFWRPLVKELLDAGADVHHVTSHGCTLLHLALSISGDTPEVAVMLLRRGINPNPVHASGGLTMLAYFVAHACPTGPSTMFGPGLHQRPYPATSRCHMINTLLDHGVEINACGGGLTALSWGIYLAGAGHNPSLLTHLISRGASHLVGHSVGPQKFSHLAMLCRFVLCAAAADGARACLNAAITFQARGARFNPEDEYSWTVQRAKYMDKWGLLALLRQSAPINYAFSTSDLEAFLCLDQWGST